MNYDVVDRRAGIGYILSLLQIIITPTVRAVNMFLDQNYIGKKWRKHEIHNFSSALILTRRLKMLEIVTTFKVW